MALSMYVAASNKGGTKRMAHARWHLTATCPTTWRWQYQHETSGVANNQAAYGEDGVMAKIGNIRCLS